MDHYNWKIIKKKTKKKKSFEFFSAKIKATEFWGMLKIHTIGTC